MRINAAYNINFNAQKMRKKEAQYLKSEFQKAGSIDIITHELSDRDGANSALIMADYLNNLGVQTRVIISQKNTKALGLKTQGQKVLQAKDIDSLDADAILCVDFSDYERVSKKLSKDIKKAQKVYCFDHHKGANIQSSAQTPKGVTPIYVDTTAKSATSIIYRFFEALKEDFNNTTAYNMFSGLVDDMSKRDYVKCDGTKGTIQATEKLRNNKNVYEIYRNLKQRLSKEDIAEIARNIDILSSLTPEEQRFQSSLIDRLRLSNNGKIAYVEILSDDKEWGDLDCDNARTSTILNRFRQSVLRNDFNSEKLNDVEMVIVFYKAQDIYRLSAHSKDNSLIDFFKYVEENKIPNFTKNAGGHSNRAGGKIFTTDKDTCHQWVLDIISCEKFYE